MENDVMWNVKRNGSENGENSKKLIHFNKFIKKNSTSKFTKNSLKMCLRYDNNLNTGKD